MTEPKHIGIALALIVAAVTGTALAQHSEYSGQEDRAIKSLSADDIDELRRSGGWGIARAAELNGVPRPSHLLELADEIDLSDKQRTRIEALYDTMQTQAIEAGERFIEAEAALEAIFRSGDITRERLRQQLARIAERRQELRRIHLEVHLDTLDIVTDEQVAEYNELRGYGTASPCDNVPEGHDPAMYRQHHGCSD